MIDEIRNSSHWTHKVRVGRYAPDILNEPGEGQTQEHTDKVEPWLSALLQVEHLNLLVGNGLTTAIAHEIGAQPITMLAASLPNDWEYSDAVFSAATKSAKASGRGEPNIEDYIRSAYNLVQGLQVLSSDNQDKDEFLRKARNLRSNWSEFLEKTLKSLRSEVLRTESCIRTRIGFANDNAQRAQQLLCSFLLSFASRPPTRERLHVFTTNYDRILEFGCDLLGLRVMDRFVGMLEPVFRASRLGVDMHYNPPGIRGEPRLLDGVIRLTKLHGSIDWLQDKTAGQPSRIVRTPLPFGTCPNHSAFGHNSVDRLMIYPNSDKDRETLEYPYAELFRDLAAALCQPNAVLFTFGYGFGDDHINRILQDMLTIPSTHLAILSYDDAGGRIPAFCKRAVNNDQISLLIGSHFGNLSTLVDHYLPKPVIDQTIIQMSQLMSKRSEHNPTQTRSNTFDHAETEIG